MCKERPHNVKPSHETPPKTPNVISRWLQRALTKEVEVLEFRKDKTLMKVVGAIDKAPIASKASKVLTLISNS